MNSWHGVGKLVADPVFKRPEGREDWAMAEFTVAVGRDARSGKGGKHEEADFIRVAAYGKTAVNVGERLRKGSKVAIDGEIRTSTYEEGGKRRFVTKVKASRVQFLDPGDIAGFASADGENEDGEPPLYEDDAMPT